MLGVSGSYRLITLATVLLVAGDSSSAGSVLRQDRAWKMYLNRATGFCISYPSRWAKSVTYEGSGLAVAAGVKRHSPIPVGSMDVSALALPRTQVASIPLGLNNDFDLQLAGLKKFARAEKVEVLEKRNFSLGANPSLFVKVRYFDPRDRRFWIDEVIFARRDGLSYRLELETRADQLQRFETNFTQFVNSFQMECGGRPSSQSASNVSSFRLTQ